MEEKMNKEIKQSLIHITVCIALGGVTTLLLSPSGIVTSSLNIDLSYLMIPLVGFFVIRLGRKLSMLFFPRTAGKILNCILQGASISVIAYIFLLWLSHVQKLGSEVGLVIESIAGYFVLIIVGITVYTLSDVLAEEDETKLFSPLTGAVGLVITGIAIYLVSKSFSKIWSPMSNVGLTIMAGLMVCSLSALAEYGERLSNRYISEISRLISSSGKWMFFLGALIFSYVFFIRGSIPDNFAYTPLIEWGIVCLGAFWLYQWVRNSVNNMSVSQSTIQVEKHTQQVEEMVDTQIKNLGDIQKGFVENGRRPRLVVTLISMMIENGWARDSIVNTINPVVEYKEGAVHWYSSIWDQNRIQEKNIRNREQILTGIISAIVNKTANSQNNLEGNDEPK